MSQKQIVIERLRKMGYVDNFWAIDNKISLRLAAIIHLLKKDKYTFEVKHGAGYDEKNCYYYLKSTPEDYRAALGNIVKTSSITADEFLAEFPSKQPEEEKQNLSTLGF